MPNKIPDDLIKARKRLQAAQTAIAIFMAQHKNGNWSNDEEAEYRRLILVEYSASVAVTDVEIDTKTRLCNHSSSERGTLRLAGSRAR